MSPNEVGIPKEVRPNSLIYSAHTYSPDSANGRASSLGAGGRRFDPGPRHTKGVKNGTSGYLAWGSAL